jgi:general stress protein YciG
MSGTKLGGALAAQTNKQKTSISLLGKTVQIEEGSMYKVIGAVGGRLGRTGGFYANRELARKAGKKGGYTSSKSRNKPDLATRRARAESFVDFQDGFESKDSHWKNRVIKRLKGTT